MTTPEPSPDPREETRRAHAEALSHLDVKTRTDRLREIASRDPELGQQLSTHFGLEGGSGFLSTGDPHTHIFGHDPERLGVIAPGDRVGEFTLGEHLGQGGMGSVFRARQESTGRDVAIKVLRDTFASEETVRRFELEARILGTLDHPNLARVVAAGTHSAEGLRVPWIAMELVEGRPLLAWAQEPKRDVRTRLELAATIADGVQHAHGKGIVHRDLKPANVLVDRQGVARVLDFGVARAVDPELRTSSFATDAGRLVGTIAWMSPEQTLGRSELIDVRSDVYALGLLTHALLTGTMPYDLPSSDIHQAIEVIRDREPRALGGLDASLRGDVETIVLRALAKEPERRYPTAAAFAADIRRYLDCQPIEARPSSTFYRLGKLARRHRLAFGLAAAGLLALVVGLVGTSTGWSRAIAEGEEKARLARVASREADEADAARKVAQKSQREEAEARRKEAAARAEADRAREAAEERAEELAREESRLRRTNELLRLVLTPGNVNENTELHEAAILLLQQAEREVELLGTQSPDVRGTFDAILGKAYHSLGDMSPGLERLERARTAFVASYGEESVPVAEVDVSLGILDSYRGSEAQVDTFFKPALAILKKELGVRDPRLLHARLEYSRALSLSLRSADSMRVAAEALNDLGSEISSEHAPDVLGLMNMKLIFATKQHRPDDAVALLEKMKTTAKTHGIPKDHPFLILGHRQMADVLRIDLNQPAESIDCMKTAVRLAASRFGPEAATTLNFQDVLADLYFSAKRYDDARKLIKEVAIIDARHTDRPPRSPRIDLVRGRLAMMDKDLDEAFAAYASAIEKAKVRPARYASLRCRSLSQQGRIRLAQKKTNEGRQLLEEAFAVREELVRKGALLRDGPRELSYLARTYPVGAKRLEIQKRNLDFCREHLPPRSRDGFIAALNLAFTAVRTKDWAIAADAYQCLPDLVASGLLKNNPKRILDEYALAGCSHLRSDQAAAAIPFLEAGYAHAKESTLTKDPSFTSVVSFLAEAYATCGRKDDRARIEKDHPLLLKKAIDQRKAIDEKRKKKD